MTEPPDTLDMMGDICMPINMPEGAVVFDFTERYDRERVKATEWGIGRYDEPRPHGMYTSEIYEPGRHIHMGIDLWAPAGTVVRTPMEGTVYRLQHHANHRDYGPTVITRHDVAGRHLYMLFGHLSMASLDRWKVGSTLERGKIIGHLGVPSENGDWPPHLHFQLSWADPIQGDMPGVVTEAERSQGLKTYPDPRILLGPIY